jgi:hypothetical protein
LGGLFILEKEKNDREMFINKIKPSIFMIKFIFKIFVLVVILIFFVSPVNAWLDNWKYRVPVVIDSSFDETNYQIKIVKNFQNEYQTGKINEDCSDLRFINRGGEILDYWIEECDISGESIIWVEVDRLVEQTDNRIYMYYGKENAHSNSDGDKTFIYFDDLEGNNRCPKIFNSPSLAIWETYENNPIIEPSQQGLDDKSIRGFAPMIDENGYMVIENGRYIGYYMAFSYEAPEARIFRIESNGLSRTDWRRESELVLDHGAYGEWDSKTVATGNVIKLNDGNYIMTYVGKNMHNYYGMGIATSHDGINWEKYAENPVLTEDDFYGPLDNTLISISIPYMIKLSDGRFVMGLEGIDPIIQQPYQYAIYLAESEDGFEWSPMNEGYSVLLPVNETWEDTHTANPKLVEISPGKYLMGYNAANSQWQLFLAFAYSTDLINWERYEMNPILSGSEEYNDRRLEDPVIIKDDLGSEKIGMYYFGCNDACHVAGSKSGAVIEYATSNQKSVCSSTKDSNRLFETFQEEIISGNSNSGMFSWLVSYLDGGHVSDRLKLFPGTTRIDFSTYFIDPSEATFSTLDWNMEDGAILKFSMDGSEREIVVKTSGGWEETGATYPLYEWVDIGIFQNSETSYDLYVDDYEINDLELINPSVSASYIVANTKEDGLRDVYIDDIRVRKYFSDIPEMTYEDEQTRKPDIEALNINQVSRLTGFIGVMETLMKAF